MPAEPMEEDDSFNDPLPRTTIFSKPFVSQVAPSSKPKNDDSDPESDDSFETFAQTQTTSTKSSSSSTQSTENKPKAPRIPPPRPSISTIPVHQKPPLQPQFSSKPSIKPMIPSKPILQNSIGVHSALKTTRDNQVQKQSTATPSSPNSFSRHKSLNSALRNSQPSPLNMRMTRTTPPIPESARPATPSGDIIMLRDQLEKEKRKFIRCQADFRKDQERKEEEHQKSLAVKEALIETQRKEIEIMKASMACRISESSQSSSNGTPTRITKSPKYPMSSIPSCSNVMNTDVKKVYPKIPAEPFRSRTPQRRQNLPQITVFQHPFKEDDEDTFQVDGSTFEPSATSTPKIASLGRTSLRRPLILTDNLEENDRGAPTPKRRPVFAAERKHRTTEELNKEILQIWREIDSEKADSLIPPDPLKLNEAYEESMELEDTDEEVWTDKLITRKMKYLQVRKTTEKAASLTARARTKITQQAAVKPMVKQLCANCQIDPISRTEPLPLITKKQWEIMEDESMERIKREAEKVCLLHYSTLISNINRRGIDEAEEANRKSEMAEMEYQKKADAVRRRTLEELRAEKRETWRTAVLDELRENGELYSSLEIKGDVQKEDCIWTSDEEDEDWQFPLPFEHPKSVLCSDCTGRMRFQRRISKREREKMKVKKSCLKEYGIEKREEMRNMSILTKSKIEAAEHSLFRENDIFATSDDEFAVFKDEGF